MDQNELKNALIEALMDKQVLDALSSVLAQNGKPQNASAEALEERIINDHVIFCATEDDEDADYFTSVEIAEMIKELESTDTDMHIRPRIFNKLLSQKALISKGERRKKYFVSAVVNEKTEEVHQFAAKEEEEEDVNFPLLVKAINGFDTVEDYKEHLQGMNKKALGKHIKKHKMNVIFDGIEEDGIVEGILEFIESKTKSQTESAKEETGGKNLKNINKEEIKSKKPKKKSKKKKKKSKK